MQKAGWLLPSFWLNEPRSTRIYMLPNIMFGKNLFWYYLTIFWNIETNWALVKMKLKAMQKLCFCHYWFILLGHQIRPGVPGDPSPSKRLPELDFYGEPGYHKGWNVLYITCSGDYTWLLLWHKYRRAKLWCSTGKVGLTHYAFNSLSQNYSLIHWKVLDLSATVQGQTARAHDESWWKYP